jgi:hypothetical protein
MEQMDLRAHRQRPAMITPDIGVREIENSFQEKKG